MLELGGAPLCGSGEPDTLTCADIALVRELPRDVPKSLFLDGSVDAIGRRAL